MDSKHSLNVNHFSDSWVHLLLEILMMVGSNHHETRLKEYVIPYYQRKLT